jgi:hypothetical protein
MCTHKMMTNIKKGQIPTIRLPRDWLLTQETMESQVLEKR